MSFTADRLLLFGATGDLAQRMLLPSLFALDADGLLGPGLKIIGTARSSMSDSEYRNFARAALEIGVHLGNRGRPTAAKEDRAVCGGRRGEDRGRTRIWPPLHGFHQLGRSGRPTAGYSIEGFAEDLHLVEDLDLWLRIAHAGWKVRACPMLVGHYTPAQGSLTSGIERCAAAEILNARMLGDMLSLPAAMVRWKVRAIWWNWRAR